jgi:hypothetical protein
MKKEQASTQRLKTGITTKRTEPQENPCLFVSIRGFEFMTPDNTAILCRAGRVFFAVALAAALAAAAGCSHTARVVNIDNYGGVSVPVPRVKKNVSIQALSSSVEEQTLLQSVQNTLRNYVNECGQAEADVEVVLSLDNAAHGGSGWNFLISWPCGLLFVPAWHGYCYTHNYVFHAKLRETASGKTLDELDIPVDLNIRHADFDRTLFSEGLAWTLWTIPALVTAPFHTAYDNDALQPVVKTAELPVGSYVAQRVAERLEKLNVKR